MILLVIPEPPFFRIAAGGGLAFGDGFVGRVADHHIEPAPVGGVEQQAGVGIGGGGAGFQQLIAGEPADFGMVGVAGALQDVPQPLPGGGVLRPHRRFIPFGMGVQP